MEGSPLSAGCGLKQRHPLEYFGKKLASRPRADGPDDAVCANRVGVSGEGRRRDWRRLAVFAAFQIWHDLCIGL